MPAMTDPGAERHEGSRPAVRSTARERLIEAATELLAYRPPSAISIRDIAEFAGVQHNLIGRYFGSKDGLVDEVSIRFLTKYAAAVAQADSAADGFRRAFDYLLQKPGGFVLFAQLALQSSERPQQPPTAYPGLALHIAQIEAERGGAPSPPPEALSPPGGLGAPDAPGVTPREPAVAAAAALAFIAGWSVLERWVTLSSHFAGGDPAALRAQMMGILDDLLSRQAGIGVAGAAADGGRPPVGGAGPAEGPGNWDGRSDGDRQDGG